jgi:adenylate cyclase class 2
VVSWAWLGVAVFDSEVMGPLFDAAWRAAGFGRPAKVERGCPLYYNGNVRREKAWRRRLRRKAQMAKEIEIKLRVNDVRQLKDRLKRMGARLVLAGTRRVHEWNTLFDTARHDLRKREQLLRTRIETPDGGVSRHKKDARQPALLTFKGPVFARRRRGASWTRGERHKVREEIEFQISDATALAKILEKLGMRPSFHYEKYRTTYRLPTRAWARGLLIELDETPIGTFMELEGPPRAIDRAAKELGFSKKDYILTNYLRLFTEDCRRRGKNMGNMVFQKRM